MLAIFGPLHLARGQRRLTQLGLPPDMAERSTDEAAAILAEAGPLTRHELAERLRARGVPVDPRARRRSTSSAAPPSRACCARWASAAARSSTARSTRPAARPRRRCSPSSPAATPRPTRPATRDDFAAWSGLPAADVRRAWVEPDPPAGEPPAGPLRLLPAFDEWLLGWASRDLVLAPEHARRVAPGGIIRPVAILDGRVVATWRLDRRARRVEVDAFGRVPRRALEAEVADLGASPGPRAAGLSGATTATVKPAPAPGASAHPLLAFAGAHRGVQAHPGGEPRARSSTRRCPPHRPPRHKPRTRSDGPQRTCARSTAPGRTEQRRHQTRPRMYPRTRISARPPRAHAAAGLYQVPARQPLVHRHPRQPPVADRAHDRRRPQLPPPIPHQQHAQSPPAEAAVVVVQHDGLRPHSSFSPQNEA